MKSVFDDSRDPFEKVSLENLPKSFTGQLPDKKHVGQLPHGIIVDDSHKYLISHSIAPGAWSAVWTF